MQSPTRSFTAVQLQSVIIAGLVVLLLSLQARAEPLKPKPAPDRPALTPAPTPRPELITIPIHVARISDDDGKRAVDVTPEQLENWVRFANHAFSSADIGFQFDAAKDISDVRSTRLNNVMGTEDNDWMEARREGNALAAHSARKGQLLVICRHGPGPSRTGKGFSWWDYNFVVMPGYSANRHCGRENISALAHEIGHYLGLPHTFAGDPFPTTKDAEEAFERSGRIVKAFDGDGIADTPPHPSIRDLECKGKDSEIRLKDVRITMPRNNLMGYFEERNTLTPGQQERVRWVARKRLEFAMSMPTNADAANSRGEIVEVESLSIRRTSGPRRVRQSMDGFGRGNWSNGFQAFFGTDDACELVLNLNVPKRGKYHATLYATQATDYGIVQAVIDHHLAGMPFDAFAPIVIPSGPIDLGVVEVSKTEVELKFECKRRNPQSTGHKMGVDCLVLTPVP